MNVLIDVKCPNCTKMMQFDNSRNYMFCPYCGGKVTLNAQPENNNQQKRNDQQRSNYQKKENEYQTLFNQDRVSNQRSDNQSFGKAPSARDVKDTVAKEPSNPNLNSSKRKSANGAIIAIAIIASAFMFFAFLVIIGTSYGTFNQPSLSSEKYTLELDISSENNILFSTYDISIFLDGKELGSVSDGKTFIYSLSVSGGAHELSFCKEGKSSPKATKRIVVNEDMKYRCELSHSSFSIDIESEYFEGIDENDDSGITILESIEQMDEISNGENFTVFDEDFNDLIIEARWWDYDGTMGDAGIYNSDTEVLAFSIQVDNDVDDRIYYAFYYSRDDEFEESELEAPIYSDVIVPEEYGDGKTYYDIECFKRIKKGNYVVIISKDASLSTPYIVAYAEV